MKELAPGHLVILDHPSQWQHVFGGEHNLDGSQCPNCAKPLILHLTLDCADARLNLSGLDLATFPLLYCMRCALCWADFTYKVAASERLEIRTAGEGALMPEWYESVNGDVFPQRPVSLNPLPADIQQLYDKLNARSVLSDEEEAVVAAFTGHFAIPEVGGYPIVDVINQVGGRAFLLQPFEDPLCEECGEPMFFLASLCNDPRQTLRVTYDGGQIVFYLCKSCRVVTARSSAS